MSSYQPSSSELERMFKDSMQKLKEDTDRLNAERVRMIREAREKKEKILRAMSQPSDEYKGWSVPTGVTTGDERLVNNVRQLFVRKGEAKRILKNLALVPHRDSVYGFYNGRVFEADSLTANEGGWWSERDAPPANTNGDFMKAFTMEELEAGQYSSLAKIETPKPGEQFDMNQLAVAAVLTLNRAIDTIQEMQEKIDELESALAANAARTQTLTEPGFKLSKIGDSYEDVKRSA